MALATYADLKAAIASWVHRTDLTAPIVDFVALAESQIRRDVRCKAMEQLATGTLTGETLAQPTRYLEARRVTLNGEVYGYVEPGSYATMKDLDSTEPKYTIIGQSFYFIDGRAGDTYSILYWAGFAPLSADSDTNWLLTNAPEIYLSGALLQAGTYLVDDAMMSKHAAIYSAAVKLLLRQERAAQYSGSRLDIVVN